MWQTKHVTASPHRNIGSNLCTSNERFYYIQPDIPRIVFIVHCFLGSPCLVSCIRAWKRTTDL